MNATVTMTLSAACSTTTLGTFALWLVADDAVTLAGQLVTIVENRETLRERYAERAEL